MNAGDHHTTTRGDPDAPFNLFFDLQYAQVFNFFKGRRLSREDSLDLAQETFVKLYRRWRSKRDEKVLEPAYLFTIATNVLRNWWRHRNTRSRPPEERRAPSEALERVSALGDPFEATLSKELFDLVRRAIEALPAQRKNCFLLHLQGVEYREIGLDLQISTSTVAVHVFQARRQLEVDLAPHFEDLSCLE